MKYFRTLAMPPLAIAAAFCCSPALAEVPLRVAASGHATVPVTIEGKGEFQFVLDTGAEGSALYSPFEKDQDIPLKAETTQLQGQTGEAIVRLANLPPLSLDGLKANGISAVVLDPRADGVPLAGIVGLDVFGGSLLDFDLARGKARFLPSGTIINGFGAGTAIAARATVGGLLTFPVMIGSTQAIAVLDTGARKTRINWKLGRLLGFDRATLAKGEVIQGATNKPVETLTATVKSARFGGVKLDAAPVLVADLPVFELFGVADGPAIIFGMDWLADIRMVVDFPLKRIWFSKAHS